MSDVKLSLTPVDALPVKERAAGPVGRPSPYTPVLEQIREAGPGQAYRITAEPLPLEPNRAGQIANRIRNGGLAGVRGGEFEASDKDGHVFVAYVGEEGIAAYDAREPERQARREARAASKAKRAAKADESITVASDDDDDDEYDNVSVPDVRAPEFASAGADPSGW